MAKNTSDGDHVEYHIINHGTFIHNIEHIEHFHGRIEDDGNSNSDEDTTLHNDLMPIFNENKEHVAVFIEKIKGCDKMSSIPKIVNRLVKDGQINSKMKYKPLWTVLNAHNIYTLSKSNWNDQIE